MLQRSRICKISMSLLVVIFLISMPITALAITVDGPNPVIANAAGSFFAAVTIHATQGGNNLSTITLTGTDNCFEVKEIDHECLLNIPYGEFYTEGFNMVLDNPDIPGTVVFTIEECSGMTLEYEIQVLPVDYVDTQKESLDSLKAFFR